GPRPGVHRVRLAAGRLPENGEHRVARVHARRSNAKPLRRRHGNDTTARASRPPGEPDRRNGAPETQGGGTGLRTQRRGGRPGRLPGPARNPRSVPEAGRAPHVSPATVTKKAATHTLEVNGQHVEFRGGPFELIAKRVHERHDLAEVDYLNLNHGPK